MDTLNVHLHADTQGEVEHCKAFLTGTARSEVSAVDLFRGNSHWFTLNTDLSRDELATMLAEAGFDAEVFSTEEYA